MTLLDSFPHRCTIRRKTQTKGSSGGRKVSYTNISTNVECWEQPASDNEAMDFEKMGMKITHKVFFKDNPNVTARHQILITSRKNRDGSTTTLSTPLALDVMSNPLPDASAGLGVCYRVLCGELTSKED